MGFFTKRCPYCGGILQETGYSAPFPAWRCPNCIKQNSEKRKAQEEITALKQRVADLERGDIKK